MHIAFHPSYAHPLPDGHRFPMAKYDLLPKRLVERGVCDPEAFFEPTEAAIETIYSAHDQAYVDAVLALDLDRKAARRIGFPMSAELVRRERIIAQGTIEGCEQALRDGVALNIAGGTHHAHRAQGGGFCIFNDQAIGARHLQQEQGLKRILIVDLDVHQGDGTADIFHEDDGVFTFSMHGEKNYPFQKMTSDLDVGLPDGTSDEVYLATLSDHVGRIVHAFEPQFIFYQSGVDILTEDKLGRLSCTLQGCARRDRQVLNTAKKLGIPIQISMGGGYAQDVDLIVEAHLQTYAIAADLY